MSALCAWSRMAAARLMSLEARLEIMSLPAPGCDHRGRWWAASGFGFVYTNSVTGSFGTVGGGMAIRAVASPRWRWLPEHQQRPPGVGQRRRRQYRQRRTCYGGGGSGNSGSGSFATVAGGANNTSSGRSATVGGGLLNTASGAVRSSAAG